MFTARLGREQQSDHTAIYEATKLESIQQPDSSINKSFTGQSSEVMIKHFHAEGKALCYTALKVELTVND
jgi:hypothetical protein